MVVAAWEVSWSNLGSTPTSEQRKSLEAIIPRATVLVAPCCGSVGVSRVGGEDQRETATSSLLSFALLSCRTRLNTLSHEGKVCYAEADKPSLRRILWGKVAPKRLPIVCTMALKTKKVSRS